MKIQSRQRPSLYVTGMNHAGSTWVMSLLKELGWDLGGPLRVDPEQRMGLVLQPLWDLWIEINHRFGHAFGAAWHTYWWSLAPEDRERIIKEYRAKVEGLRIPAVVKSKHAPQVWLPILRPKHVIVMARPVEQWMTSVEVREGQHGESRAEEAHNELGQIGATQAVCMGLKIPFTVVPWPDIGYDSSVAWGWLGHVAECEPDRFVEAHRRVTNPRWLHREVR